MTMPTIYSFLGNATPFLASTLLAKLIRCTSMDRKARRNRQFSTSKERAVMTTMPIHSHANIVLDPSGNVGH
jgi:hypothetical protein